MKTLEKEIDWSELEDREERHRSISLLLGAGFSIPMDYPTGGELNNKVQTIDEYPIIFTYDGRLAECKRRDEMPYSLSTNIYQKRFELCKALIKAYSERNEFDYEHFMDFLYEEDIYREPYTTIGNSFTDEHNNYQSMVGGLPNIYSQVVAHLLKDADEKSWYEDSIAHIGPYVNDKREAYNGFLDFLRAAKKKYVINVHTLNHDLFFESLRYNDVINGDFSDGFDDFRSRYYGKLETNLATYRCRLARYTGRYNGSSVRLYKLHGSLDYVLIHRMHPNGFLKPDKEVKLKYGIGLLDLEREKSRSLGYESDISQYHADFLTGTTSKMKIYDSPYFYKKIFRKVRNNLTNADYLIIIGYGCKDEGINEYLTKYFDYAHKQVFVIDPSVENNATIKELADNLHAKKFACGVDKITKEAFHIF